MARDIREGHLEGVLPHLTFGSSLMQSDVRGVPATVGLPTMMPLVMLHARRFLCSAWRESG
jgi:hypothetical protein